MNIRYTYPILVLVAIFLVQGIDPAQAAPDGRPPLRFIENQGQVHDDVAYYVQGLEQTVFFTQKGVTFALRCNDGSMENSGSSSISRDARLKSRDRYLEKRNCALADQDSAGHERWTVRLEFEGADVNTTPEGLDPQPGVYSFFKGRPADWKQGVPTFGDLIYRDLWPGIDLVYMAGQDRLKYEFHVKPGADPDAIRLVYRGVTDLHLDTDGALSVITPAGTIEDAAPVAFQHENQERIECPVCFTEPAQTGDGAYTVGFDVGRYDRNKTLILDPAMLVYCGYLGGASTDAGTSVAADAEGNTYVAGFTLSTESSFPVTVGPNLTYCSDWDTYVAKISADGTQLLYCGYIGGDGNDREPGICVDHEGAAYIAGITRSSESSLPVKVGPDLTSNGGADAFVAKVLPDGTDLEFCGFVGGSQNEGASDHCGIALDGAGNLYMTCYTELFEPKRDGQAFSKDTPLLNYDIFYAKIKPDGSAFLFQGAVSGDDHDIPHDLAVDADQNIYIAGHTFSSNSEGFPVTVGPDLSFNGGETDGFVLKINADGSTLDYCGYIGGGSIDNAAGIDLDDDGHAYVAGLTLSSETTFPVVVGPDLTGNGLKEAYVAKVKPDGTGLVYCGYIGGDKFDEACDIDVDADGNAWVLGHTASDETSFPVKGGPGVEYRGMIDLFIALVNAAGTGLDYCGYIGGFNNEFASVLFLDDHGAIHIVADTKSDDSVFPGVAGPDLTYNGGLQDTLVAKIIIAPGLSADVTNLSAASGGTVNFELFAGLSKASRNYLLLGGVSGTEPGTLLPHGFVTLPLNWDIYTDIVMSLLNSSLFMDFFGDLDVAGEGTAQLNAPALPSTAIGLNMVYAFCLGYPWQFASDPVQIQILP